MEQAYISIAGAESYADIVEIYQVYAGSVAGEANGIDAMDTTGLGTPGTTGQERRNLQYAFLRREWRAFFADYHPLTTLYAKKLIIACDGSVEDALYELAHCAPRQHKNGTNMRHPFAYIMETIENRKKGLPGPEDEPEENEGAA